MWSSDIYTPDVISLSKVECERRLYVEVVVGELGVQGEKEKENG